MEVAGTPVVGLLSRRRRARKGTSKRKRKSRVGGIAGLAVHGSSETRLREYVRSNRSRASALRARVSDELNCYCTSRRRVSLDEWVDELCKRNQAADALNIFLARTGSSTACASASAGLRFRLEEHMFGEGDFFSAPSEDVSGSVDVDADCFTDPSYFGERVSNPAFTETPSSAATLRKASAKCARK